MFLMVLLSLLRPLRLFLVNTQGGCKGARVKTQLGGYTWQVAQLTDRHSVPFVALGAQHFKAMRITRHQSSSASETNSVQSCSDESVSVVFDSAALPSDILMENCKLRRSGRLRRSSGASSVVEIEPGEIVEEEGNGELVDDKLTKIQNNAGLTKLRNPTCLGASGSTPKKERTASVNDVGPERAIIGKSSPKQGSQKKSRHRREEDSHTRKVRGVRRSSSIVEIEPGEIVEEEGHGGLADDGLTKTQAIIENSSSKQTLQKRSKFRSDEYSQTRRVRGVRRSSSIVEMEPGEIVDEEGHEGLMDDELTKTQVIIENSSIKQTSQKRSRSQTDEYPETRKEMGVSGSPGQSSRACAAEGGSALVATAWRTRRTSSVEDIGPETIVENIISKKRRHRNRSKSSHRRERASLDGEQDSLAGKSKKRTRSKSRHKKSKAPNSTCSSVDEKTPYKDNDKSLREHDNKKSVLGKEDLHIQTDKNRHRHRSQLQSTVLRVRPRDDRATVPDVVDLTDNVPKPACSPRHPVRQNASKRNRVHSSSEAVSPKASFTVDLTREVSPQSSVEELDIPLPPSPFRSAAPPLPPSPPRSAAPPLPPSPRRSAAPPLPPSPMTSVAPPLPPHTCPYSTSTSGPMTHYQPMGIETKKSNQDVNHSASQFTPPDEYTRNRRNFHETSVPSSESGSKHFSRARKPKYGKLAKQWKKLRERAWEWTGFGNAHHMFKQPGMEFRIVSYNLLSQDLLDGHPHLYSHVSDKWLSWSYRGPNLISEMQDIQADIYCLQEMHHEHYEDFVKPEMEKLGYECVYKKKTSDKKDGCAIIFRTSKFTLQDAVPVEYFRPGVWTMDRDNIALLVRLRTKSDNKPLVVGTTHLLFNNRRGDVKLTQNMTLLAEVDKLAYVHHTEASSGQPYRSIHCPVIICGDFNMQPWCPQYDLMTAGHLTYQGLHRASISGQREGGQFGPVLSNDLMPSDIGIADSCRYKDLAQQCWKRYVEYALRNPHHPNPSLAASQPPARLMQQSSGALHHALGLSSVYRHSGKSHEEITTFHQQDMTTVDYIFYSSKPQTPFEADLSTPTQLRLIGYLRLPWNIELKKYDKLPNQILSSDHFMLAADFLMP